MVGNFEGQRNVMRYHDAGSAEHLLQAIEQVGDDVTTNGIKPGRRFVVQNALWTLHDGPCQRDTLALATGKFTGKTINTCFDTQQGQDFLGGLAPLRRIHRRVLAKRKGDVLQHRHGIKQRSLLKQEPDATSNVYEALLTEARALMPGVPFVPLVAEERALGPEWYHLDLLTICRLSPVVCVLLPEYVCHHHHYLCVCHSL